MVRGSAWEGRFLGNGPLLFPDSQPGHDAFCPAPSDKKGTRMRQSVTFISNGNGIVGHLHLPDEVQPGETASRGVVVGPASGVEGQVPTVYAERLAELNYAALSFDHSTYGESEGWPRSDGAPFAKIEDVKNAVTSLARHDQIDVDQPHPPERRRRVIL